MVPVKTNSNWLPSIFNDFFENEWLAKTGVTAPAINVIENDKDYKVEMAAPGMTKDDFKVNVDENNNLHNKNRITKISDALSLMNKSRDEDKANGGGGNPNLEDNSDITKPSVRYDT